MLIAAKKKGYLIPCMLSAFWFKPDALIMKGTLWPFFGPRRSSFIYFFKYIYIYIYIYIYAYIIYYCNISQLDIILPAAANGKKEASEKSTDLFFRSFLR